MPGEFINPQSYLNKDFQSIYVELLDTVKQLSSKWDPTISNESDPGVVLLKANAIIADKNCYNIDKNILELFPDTVAQENNARSLYSQLGYKMKWCRSATGVLYLRWQGEASLGEEGITIPKYTMVSDSNSNIVYSTLADVTLNDNNLSAVVSIAEGVNKLLKVNGSEVITIDSIDNNNRLYLDQYMVAENGILVSTNGSNDMWEQVDNIYTVTTGTKAYEFVVDSLNSVCYLQFPSDIHSLIESGINVRYLLCSGSQGNVPEKYLTDFYSEVGVEVDGGVVKLTSAEIQMYNYNAILNGSDPESMDDAYKNYKKTIGTFDTLVTLRDYTNALNRSMYVSNGFATDRTNDPQCSYYILTEDEVNPSVLRLTQSAEGNPSMTAFDLKLYCLNNCDAYSTGEQYNKSFTPVNTSSSVYNAICRQMRDNKSVEHDYADHELNVPFMFKNYYPIKAKISTHNNLTDKEQEEVTSNIISHLYESINSSIVSFGEHISYDHLYKCILESDTRVKDVFIDDLEYCTYYCYWAGGTDGGFVERPLHSSSLLSINNSEESDQQHSTQSIPKEATKLYTVDCGDGSGDVYISTTHEGITYYISSRKSEKPYMPDYGLHTWLDRLCVFWSTDMSTATRFTEITIENDNSKSFITAVEVEETNYAYILGSVGLTADDDGMSIFTDVCLLRLSEVVKAKYNIESDTRSRLLIFDENNNFAYINSSVNLNGQTIAGKHYLTANSNDSRIFTTETEYSAYAKFKRSNVEECDNSFKVRRDVSVKSVLSGATPWFKKKSDNYYKVTDKVLFEGECSNLSTYISVNPFATEYEPTDSASDAVNISETDGSKGLCLYKSKSSSDTTAGEYKVGSKESIKFVGPSVSYDKSYSNYVKYEMVVPDASGTTVEYPVEYDGRVHNVLTSGFKVRKTDAFNAYTKFRNERTFVVDDPGNEDFTFGDLGSTTHGLDMLHAVKNHFPQSIMSKFVADGCLYNYVIKTIDGWYLTPAENGSKLIAVETEPTEWTCKGIGYYSTGLEHYVSIVFRKGETNTYKFVTVDNSGKLGLSDNLGGMAAFTYRQQYVEGFDTSCSIHCPAENIYEVSYTMDGTNIVTTEVQSPTMYLAYLKVVYELGLEAVSHFGSKPNYVKKENSPPEYTFSAVKINSAPVTPSYCIKMHDYSFCVDREVKSDRAMKELSSNEFNATNYEGVIEKWCSIEKINTLKTGYIDHTHKISWQDTEYKPWILNKAWKSGEIYLYYVRKEKTIPKDSVYQLRDGEYITFFWRSEDGADAPYQYYTYKGSDDPIDSYTIKTNVEIKASAISDCKVNPEKLGTEGKIYSHEDEFEIVKGLYGDYDLSGSKEIKVGSIRCVNIKTSQRRKLYFYGTNVVNNHYIMTLHKFEHNSTSGKSTFCRVLSEGETFVNMNNSGSEFETLRAGSLITVTCSDPRNTLNTITLCVPYYKVLSFDSSAIENIITNGLTLNHNSGGSSKFNIINSSGNISDIDVYEVKYMEQQIVSLSEGDVVRVEKKEQPNPDDVVDDITIDSYKYTTLDGSSYTFTYKTKDAEDFVSVPITDCIDSLACWRARAFLNVDVANDDPLTVKVYEDGTSLNKGKVIRMLYHKGSQGYCSPLEKLYTIYDESKSFSSNKNKFDTTTNNTFYLQTDVSHLLVGGPDIDITYTNMYGTIHKTMCYMYQVWDEALIDSNGGAWSVDASGNAHWDPTKKNGSKETITYGRSSYLLIPIRTPKKQSVLFSIRCEGQSFKLYKGTLGAGNALSSISELGDDFFDTSRYVRLSLDSNQIILCKFDGNDKELTLSRFVPISVNSKVLPTTFYLDNVPAVPQEVLDHGTVSTRTICDKHRGSISVLARNISWRKFWTRLKELDPDDTFNYMYECEGSTILNATSPESFLDANHPYNNSTICQGSIYYSLDTEEEKWDSDIVFLNRR